MPKYRVTLDGRTFDLVGDHPPSEAEAREAVGAHLQSDEPPPAPAPQQTAGEAGRPLTVGEYYAPVGRMAQSMWNHPIETLGGLGAGAAVAATAPVSVPATLAAAALGGAGGAGLGLLKNAISPTEDSPTTATGVVGEMGKQGAINAAFEGLGLVGRGGLKLAKNLYLRALKPTKAVLESAPAFRAGGQEAARQELAQTALNERAAVGGGGVRKIQGRIEDTNQAIADRIAEGDLEGRFVDPIQVAQRAGDVKSRFANQVAPQGDLRSVDQTIADFMAHPSFGSKGGAASTMSLADAQAMKQGTYRTLGGKAYGEVGSASGEAQKALARGLKEEISAQAPEVAGLNLDESKLITLEKALQDRARTTGNADPLKLAESVMMAGVAPKKAGLALVNRPGILSRGAIGLNEASKFYNAMPAANMYRSALLGMLGQDQP